MYVVCRIWQTFGLKVNGLNGDKTGENKGHQKGGAHEAKGKHVEALLGEYVGKCRYILVDLFDHSQGSFVLLHHRDSTSFLVPFCRRLLRLQASVSPPWSEPCWLLLRVVPGTIRVCCTAAGAQGCSDCRCWSESPWLWLVLWKRVYWLVKFKGKCAISSPCAESMRENLMEAGFRSQTMSDLTTHLGFVWTTFGVESRNRNSLKIEHFIQLVLVIYFFILFLCRSSAGAASNWRRHRPRCLRSASWLPGGQLSSTRTRCHWRSRTCRSPPRWASLARFTVSSHTSIHTSFKSQIASHETIFHCTFSVCCF